MTQGVYYDSWSAKQPIKYDSWGEASSLYPMPAELPYSTLYSADFTVELPAGWSHTNTSSASYWDGDRIQYTAVDLEVGRTVQSLRSYTFDGTNDFVSVPDSDDFHLSTHDFTLELWIRPTTVTGIKDVIGQRAADSFGAFVLYIQDGNLKFVAGTGSSWNVVDFLTVLGPVNINTVYHVAVTRQGSNFYGFINGVGGLIYTSSLAIVNNASPLKIGSTESTGAYYAGSIWDVRLIVGTALYTHNFPTPITYEYEANTKLHLKMDEGSGTTAFDSSGLAHHGTLVNGVVHATSSAYGSDYQNLVGYNDGSGAYTGVLIPRDESDIPFDVLGNALAFTGEASSNARFEPWGMLLEAADSNVLLNSADFNSWTKGTGISVATNTAISPDGSVTADTVTESNASASTGITQTYTAPTTSGILSYSIFVKKNTSPTAFPVIRLRGNTYGISINSATGAVSVTTDFAGSWEKKSLISKEFGGYWRVSLSVAYTYDVSRPNLSFDFRPAFGTTYSTFDATAQGSEIAWGVSTSFYSYIPTTAASVSRSTDVVIGSSLATVTNNGAYMVEFSLPRDGAAYTDNNYICKLYDENGKSVFIRLGSSNSFSYSGSESYFTINKTPLTAFTLYRVLIQTRDNGTNELYLNGTQIATGAYNTTSLTGSVSFYYSNSVKAWHFRKFRVYTELAQADAESLSTIPLAASAQFNAIGNSQYVGVVL